MSAKRILIGYDGSECAEAVLADLARAGLPANAEVVVMTVADVFLPAKPMEVSPGALPPAQLHKAVERARARAAAALDAAQTLVDVVAKRVKVDFPGWEVRAEACADSPAWALIKTSDSWPADLIMVGTRGKGLKSGRLILGSVSQRVLYEAHCSVRVARQRGVRRDGGIRVLVGFDGSLDAKAATQAIASRAWPAGTEARVVSVVEAMLTTSPEAPAEVIRAAGLTVSTVMREGRPIQVLLEEAESWKADSIFVGTKGIGAVGRLLLGSVSSALAARAQCSVEVVRSHAT